MTDRFAQLLQELSEIFQTSLQPDAFHACSLLIPPHPPVVLQLDESQEFLFLFSKIISLSPGRFREDVLREALKANGKEEPRPGTLGYIAASNTLAIHQKFPAALLNGELLATFIGSLLEMATHWKTAIEHGQAGPL